MRGTGRASRVAFPGVRTDTVKDLLCERQSRSAGGAIDARLRTHLHCMDEVLQFVGQLIAAGAIDVELSSAALSAAGAALGHGGIVALDERIGVAELVSHLWSFAASESCGACSPCRIGCHRGLQLAELAVRGEDEGEHAALCDVMADASLCAFGRAVPAAVRSALRAYDVAERSR